MAFTHQAHTMLEFILPGTHNVIFAPGLQRSVTRSSRYEQTIVSETAPMSVVNGVFSHR